MIKIRALNEEVGEDEEHQKGTREALEDAVLSSYNQALQLLADSKIYDAANSLEELLLTPYLQNHVNKRSCPLQIQVRLGCLKSLSTIYGSLNPNPEKAIRVILEAIELEPKNMNLWYRLGSIALRAKNFTLAKEAFQESWNLNPLHWKCLENLITVTFLLDDYVECLYYCACGLGNDSTFLKGVVFRDKIFEMLPYLKKTIATLIPNSDKLATGQMCDEKLKSTYLDEVRLLRSEQILINQEKKTEELKVKILVSSERCRKYTLTELCHAVRNLHTRLQSEGTILQPIDLTGECIEISGGSIEGLDKQVVVNDDRVELDESSQTSVRRNSSDEKDATFSNDDSRAEMMDVEDKLDNTVDDNGNQHGKDDILSKKKPRRDLKWWQLEGKRRSQRVRSLLVMPIQNNTPKEHNFGEKLKSIIPESLLVLGESEKVNAKQVSRKQVQPTVEHSDNYFGTAKEADDVKLLIKQYGQTNISELVAAVAVFLAQKMDSQWPDELGSEYLHIYQIYRSLTSFPDFFNADNVEMLHSDSQIVLAMLEVAIDKAYQADKRKNDLTYTTELAQLHNFASTTEDKIFWARFGWLLVKYFLLKTSQGQSTYEEAIYYLNAVETYLTALASPELVLIKTPAKNDNIISLEVVKNKRHFVNNLANIGRVTELYESRMFEELIEILNISLASENIGETGLAHRYYLAEAYFHVNKSSECLEQSLNIITSCVTRREAEPMLAKCVTLVENVCSLCSFDLSPMKEKKQVLATMVDLLIANEQRHFHSGKLWTTPWCIIHSILFKTERQEPFIHLFEDSIPNSVVLLKFAHEYLSQFNKCLENNGKLLFHTLDALVSVEECKDYEATKHCIEQAIFCLYSHPTKKSKLRHLTEHNSRGVQLELVKCVQLFDYYKPETVPEFDTFEGSSINSEIEGLFQRILKAIPDDLKPTRGYDCLKSYLEGKIETLDDSLTEDTHFPVSLGNIYYLIADHHYHKANEWVKAVEFYTWDLSINAWRFDSWAAIALAKGEIINSLLNSCDNVNIDEVTFNADIVVKCFQKALDLDSSNWKLRTEFGSFVYAIHAACARLLKKKGSQLTAEKFELITKQKTAFLSVAMNCFERGVQKSKCNLASSELESHHEEDWLHHYMLGKVMEKLDPGDPVEYLSQYETAGKLLHEQHAVYPAKLSFNNAPDLAIEALEIYYRIHASIMSYIEKYDLTQDMEDNLQKFIDRALRSPFMKAKLVRGEAGDAKKKRTNEKDVAEIKKMVEGLVDRVTTIAGQELEILSSSDSPCSTLSTSSASSDSADDELDIPPQKQSFALSVFRDKINEENLENARVREAEAAKLELEKAVAVRLFQAQKEAQLKETEEVVEINPYFQHLNQAGIISQCVKAFEECLFRFSAHHKSHYRISYTYFKFGKDSLNVCKDWLLRGGVGEKKKMPGLFGDRKPSNLFNGIWRNPVDDIERPGSFPYHMSKTINHLLEVLNDSNDHEMLAEIGVHLSKTPEHDKQYLYTSERELFLVRTINNCVQAAQRYFTENRQNIMESATAIFGSYVKLQKLNGRDNALGSLLLQVYRIHLQEKQLDSTNVTVDHAFRYFQHMAWATKLGQAPTNGGKNGTMSGKTLCQDKSKFVHTLTSVKKRCGNLKTIPIKVPNAATYRSSSPTQKVMPPRKKPKLNNTANPLFRQFCELENFSQKFNVSSAARLPPTQSEKLILAPPAQLVTSILAPQNIMSCESISAASSPNSARELISQNQAIRIQTGIPVSNREDHPNKLNSSFSQKEKASFVLPATVASHPTPSTSASITQGYPSSKTVKMQSRDKTLSTKAIRLCRVTQMGKPQPTNKVDLPRHTSTKNSCSLNSANGNRVVVNIANNKVFLPCQSNPKPIPDTNRSESPPHNSYPIINFNTSPFRAQSNIMVSPDQHLTCNRNARDPLSLTPPNAHSQVASSSTSYFSSNPEIIDLTTKFTVRSTSPTLFHEVHPETTVNEKRQITMRNGTRPRPRLLPDLISLQSKPMQEKVYPLPPKKKRLAFELMYEQQRCTEDARKPEIKDSNIEIITLE